MQEQVGTIEWLGSPESLQGQYRAWMQPTTLATGEVLLTYEMYNYQNQKRELRFSISADGKNFTSSKAYQQGAQMTRFAEFADGTWVFVYQVGNGSDMMDYLQISKDHGASFSEAIPVSSQLDVHDPVLFQRRDGALDVYYGVSNGVGYSVHRRKLNQNGTLGAEERLTPLTLDLEKSQVLRLSSGKIIVNAGLVNHESLTSELMSFFVDEDAP